jgi:hypothetical protein
MTPEEFMTSDEHRDLSQKCKTAIWEMFKGYEEAKGLKTKAPFFEGEREYLSRVSMYCRQFKVQIDAGNLKGKKLLRKLTKTLEQDLAIINDAEKSFIRIPPDIPVCPVCGKEKKS